MNKYYRYFKHYYRRYYWYHHGHHHRSRHFHFRHLINKALSFCNTFCRKTVEMPCYIILALVAAMPGLYGGGVLWWLPLCLSLVSLSLLFWIITGWWCGGKHLRIHMPLGLSVFALLLFVTVLQGCHWGWLEGLLPERIVYEWQSVQGLFTPLDGIVPHVDMSLSLNPDRTFTYLRVLLVCGGIYLVLVSKARHRLHLKFVLLAIVCAALFNAMHAYYGFFTSNNALVFDFHGTFLNRNHFGFLMMLGSLAGVSLLATINSRNSIREGDEEVWKKWHKLTLPLALTIFLLVTAIVLSLSRGAFVATLIAMCGFGVIWIIKGRDLDPGQKPKVLALIIMVSVAFLGAVPYAMSKLSERFESLDKGSLTMDTRVLVWKDTVKLIRDYWLSGVGMGTYGDVIQRYASSSYSKHEFVEHAHNDYLELASEIGVPMTALLLVIAIVIVLRCLYKSWHHSDPTYRWAGFGASMAVIGCAIHEFFDFNLRAWSNAVVLAAFFAVLSICAMHRAPSGVLSSLISKHEQHKRDRRARRIRTWTMLPVSLLLCFFAFRFCINDLMASVYKKKLFGEFDDRTSLYVMGSGDLERHRTLAEKIEVRSGELSDVLAARAISTSGYIELNAKKLEPPRIKKLWHEACADIARSVQMAPADGEVLLTCAKIFKEANRFSVRFDDDMAVLAIFEKAEQNLPTILDCTNEVAMAFYQSYLRSLTQRPELSDVLRLKSLQYMTHLVDLRGDGNAQIFSALARLHSDYRALLTMIPQDFKAQCVLLDFLISKRQYEVALEYAESILTGLQTAGGDPAVPSEDINELVNVDERLYVQSRKCYLLEMLGRTEARERLWISTINLARLSNRRASLDESVFSDSEALERVWRSIWQVKRTYPQNAHNVLNAAKICQFRGKIDEMVHELLPLAYMAEESLPVSLLEEAKKLDVRQIIESDETGIIGNESVFRANFIFSVIDILLAEKGVPTDLAKLKRAMADLERMVMRREDYGWIQHHLVSYYLGRLYELIGDNEGALGAYRRCLDLSKDNLYALRRIAELDEEQLDTSETEILGKILVRQTPVCLFTNGLLWLATEVGPREISKLHEMVEFRVIFVVTGEMIESPSFDLIFFDQQGTLFSQRVSFLNEASLVWRIGEIVSFNFTIQPQVRAMRAVRREIVPGNVWLRVTNAKTVPEACERVLEVK